MTRATERPLRRVLKTRVHLAEEVVVELTTELITIRPVRTRRGGRAEVSVPAGTLYERLLVARALGEKKARKRRGK